MPALWILKCCFRITTGDLVGTASLNSLCGNDSLDTVICDATFLSFRQELCSSLKNVHPSVRRSSDSRINGRQVTLMFGFDNFVGNPFLYEFCNTSPNMSS